MKVVKIKDLLIGEIYQDVENEDMNPCIMKFVEFREDSILFEYISGYDGYKDEYSNEIELGLTQEMNFTFIKL